MPEVESFTQVTKTSPASCRARDIPEFAMMMSFGRSHESSFSLQVISTKLFHVLHLGK